VIQSWGGAMVLRGLIVREPFATMIVQGIKKWEIRKCYTRIRGRILIIGNSYLKGAVTLADVLGPFSVNDLDDYVNYHRVSREFLEQYSRGRQLYAWVLKDPIMFKHPVKIGIRKGAQVWVKIDESLIPSEIELI